MLMSKIVHELTSLIVCVGIFSTSDGAVSMESERSVFNFLLQIGLIVAETDNW